MRTSKECSKCLRSLNGYDRYLLGNDTNICVECDEEARAAARARKFRKPKGKPTRNKKKGGGGL